MRQLYDEVLERAGLCYGDAWLEKDGKRLHPDSDFNPLWDHLNLVHDPMRAVDLRPPLSQDPPAAASSQEPPAAASSQGPDAGLGAGTGEGTGASMPEEDNWRTPNSLRALNRVQWPESCEWPCILHMGKNVPTEALTRPPWKLFEERFPRRRFFVSITFGVDVVVLGGFPGMQAKHAMVLMESLYMAPFSVRWDTFIPEFEPDYEFKKNTWLIAKMEEESLV